MAGGGRAASLPSAKALEIFCSENEYCSMKYVSGFYERSTMHFSQALKRAGVGIEIVLFMIF